VSKKCGGENGNERQDERANEVAAEQVKQICRVFRLHGVSHSKPQHVQQQT
jgi:hypothetical protein